MEGHMRVHPILPLVVALAVASCDDAVGPQGNGRLVITTSTVGEAPDEDGYLLLLDDAESVTLGPAGTTEVNVTAGRHRLRLLGVAGHCAVTPGTSLDVDVPRETAQPVDYRIDCPATGVRVTTVTTGLDLDASGYRITADGADRGAVPASGTMLIRLEPGARTIALTDLAANCSLVGPGSHAATVVTGEVVPLHFDAECLAATGVVGVAFVAEGVDTDGEYGAELDGVHHPVQPARTTYLAGVTPGSHLVALRPPANCAAQTEPQSVTVTAGGTIRDTVEVSFAVTCTTRVASVEVSVQTSGTAPPQGYTVWVCAQPDFYCAFYPYLLGSVGPNGTLVAPIDPGTYDLWLADIPTTCGHTGRRQFAIVRGQTVPLSFTVSCP
jgi:hypothetical protein